MVDTESLKDIKRLLLQLTGEKSPLTRSQLKRILSNPNLLCVVIFDGSRIIGTASVYIHHQFEKTMGHVEEVVVDETYRGQGLGKKLMGELMRLAKKKGIKELDLTSRPVRVAANALYQKLGFVQRETNVYRKRL